jgi:hypothetical protein
MWSLQVMLPSPHFSIAPDSERIAATVYRVWLWLMG